MKNCCHQENSGVHEIDWVTNQLRDPAVLYSYLKYVRVLADHGDEWARQELDRIEQSG